MHTHRTTVLLYAVLRSKYWFEDGSWWPVDEMEKIMKTSVSGLAPVGAIKLLDWGPRDSPKW